MPKQFEQFDFSIEKNQKKFSDFTEGLKKDIIDYAEVEAIGMQDKINTGKTRDYDEAEKKIEIDEKLRIEEVKKIIKANCSWFFKRESNYYSEIAERVVEGEKWLKIDNRENGDKAAEIMKECFSKYAKQELKKKEMSEFFTHAALNWDNFKDILYVSMRTDEDREDIRCNGISFDPLVPLIEKGNEELKLLVENIINNSFFEHYTGAWRGSNSSDSAFHKNLSDIEQGAFCKENGFYVAPTFCSWGASGDKGKKKKTILYFNNFLMKIIKPSSEITSKYIFPIDKHPTQGDYLNEKKKFVIAADRLEAGYGEISLKKETGEKGDVEFTLALLAGKNHDLTFYSNVLGLALEIPPGSISRTMNYWGENRNWSVDLKDRDPILLKLLSNDVSRKGAVLEGMDETRLKNISPDLLEDLSNEVTVSKGSVSLEGTKLNIDPFVQTTNINENSKCVTFPIMRIIPEILSGVIEYGENNEVLRVAVPEKGKFKVYDKNSFLNKENA